MQLQVDPPVNTHRHDLLHISGTCAEGEAVERVHGTLLLVRAGVGVVFFLGEQLRNGTDHTQTQQQSRQLGKSASHEDSRKESTIDYEPIPEKKLRFGVVRA